MYSKELLLNFLEVISFYQTYLDLFAVIMVAYTTPKNSLGSFPSLNCVADFEFYQTEHIKEKESSSQEMYVKFVLLATEEKLKCMTYPVPRAVLAQRAVG